MTHLLTPLSSIGAYLGELAKNFRAKPSVGSVSPFVFLQACGVLFKDESGKPLNGDSPQDTSQFINELLVRLHEEEMVERISKADAEKPSFVQDLFNVQQGTKVSHHCRKTTWRE